MTLPTPTSFCIIRNRGRKGAMEATAACKSSLIAFGFRVLPAVVADDVTRSIDRNWIPFRMELGFLHRQLSNGAHSLRLMHALFFLWALHWVGTLPDAASLKLQPCPAVFFPRRFFEVLGMDQALSMDLASACWGTRNGVEQVAGRFSYHR